MKVGSKCPKSQCFTERTKLGFRNNGIEARHGCVPVGRAQMLLWTKCWTSGVEKVVVRTSDDDSGKPGEVGIARQAEEKRRKKNFGDATCLVER